MKVALVLQRARTGAVRSFREFGALLGAFRFRHRRTTGSHRLYRHETLGVMMNVQTAGRDAKPYQVRQFLAMIDRLGLEAED